MQDFLALEAWVVLLAAPCIVSWILGEMHGAARMQKITETGMAAGRHEIQLEGLSISPDRRDKAYGIQCNRAEAGLPERRRFDRRFVSALATYADPKLNEGHGLVDQPDRLGSSLTAEADHEDALWRKRELEAVWAENEGALQRELAEITENYRVSIEGLARPRLQATIAASSPAFAPAAFSAPPDNGVPQSCTSANQAHIG